MRYQYTDPILKPMQYFEWTKQKTVYLCLLLALFALGGCADPDRPTIGFYLALQRGDIDQIERHIFWKTDVNKQGPDGKTPLHIAADKGRPIVVEILLKHGANIEGKDSENHAPLYTAVMSGRTQVAELLIEKGAQFDNNWLLIESVRNNINDRDVFRLLLQKGADINHLSDQGDTPLLAAINQGNRALVKMVIANGSDVNLAGKSGKTPLQLAEARNEPSIVRLLKKNGALTAQKP